MAVTSEELRVLKHFKFYPDGAQAGDKNVRDVATGLAKRGLLTKNDYDPFIPKFTITDEGREAIAQAKMPAPPEPKAKEVNREESVLSAALRSQLYDEKPEIINGVDVMQAAKSVDLSIAYSPVLTSRNTIHPVNPISTRNGQKFVIHDTIFGTPFSYNVSAEELKVMRARFLLWQGEYMNRFYLDTWTDPVERDRVVSEFFGGQVFVSDGIANLVKGERGVIHYKKKPETETAATA